MKTLFESKALHLTACILFFWKGISLILWLLLKSFYMFDLCDGFFFSTGFASVLTLVAAIGFTYDRTFILLVLAVMCIAFIVYWVFFVLLAINCSSAGVASVGLLILCGLDMPLTALLSFDEGWPFLLFITFHAAVFIIVALLRRSRPEAATPLSEIPTSI